MRCPGQSGREQNIDLPELANRSGLVGRYMCGHGFLSAMIEIDARIYPGMNEQHGLISRQFFRSRPGQPFGSSKS